MDSAPGKLLTNVSVVLASQSIDPSLRLVPFTVRRPDSRDQYAARGYASLDGGLSHSLDWELESPSGPSSGAHDLGGGANIGVPFWLFLGNDRCAVPGEYRLTLRYRQDALTLQFAVTEAETAA